MDSDENDGTNPPEDEWNGSPKQREANPDRLHTFSREALEERYRTLKGTEAHLRATLESERAAAEETRNSHECLAQKLAAYEAGRDDSDRVEGVVRTPGQLWAQLLDSPMPERAHMLEMAIRNTEGLRECFVADHQGRIGHLEFELQDVQAKLGTTLGFDTPQSLHSLTVAVQALKNVMVEGIARRPPVVEPTDADYPADLLEYNEDFPVEAGVAEKITEQLKTAGIDTQSICGYEWGEYPPDADTSICYRHDCTAVNPLHADAHVCGGCGTTLTHEEAEKLEAAK